MLEQKKEIILNVENVSTIEALEGLRVQLLGKNGSIGQAMKDISSLTPEEKRDTGAKLNQLKHDVNEAIEKRKLFLEKELINVKLKQEKVDITQPCRFKSFGKIHPITQAMQELIAIFNKLGFGLAYGPEIEDDYHNFTALNIPKNHPARQMHDTFYMSENLVLRTHTSNVQVRTMENGKPPFKFISPGRVYRFEHDQTHSPMFHQLEGLYIDKNIHMGHLKWCLQEFLKMFFEVAEVEIRLRPSFFPFTEPSAEVDIGYSKVNHELKIGASENWLEILGCGMVHRKVIENVGLNPDEYQGFAFGIGIDRLAMLKYGVNDLRQFFESDMRFLNNSGFSVFDIPNFINGLSR